MPVLKALATATLLTASVCNLSAQGGASQTLSEDQDYANLARRAVIDAVRKEGRAVEQLRIELVGRPVIPGDHISLHRSPIPLGRNLRPFALVAVDSGRRRGYYLVEFEDGRPHVTPYPSTLEEVQAELAVNEISRNPAFLRLSASDRRQLIQKLEAPVFTEFERRQITRELATFWDAWLDVAQGPERLAPFLADEVACLFFDCGSAVRVPMDGRSCAAGVLEVLSFQAWDCIESPYCHFGFDTGQLEQEIRASVQRHALIGQEFREAGIFDPQHRALLRPYLGRYLKEGVIEKVPAAYFAYITLGYEMRAVGNACLNPQSEEEALACLQAWLSRLPSGSHYVVAVISEQPVLFFARKGRSLRLIGIFGAGG